VTLKDGRSYSEGYYPAKGATDNPLTREELLEKFNECAEWGRVPPGKARRAIEILLDLERMSTADELMSCLSAEHATGRQTK
jgi:2-methylcitrate dehydratase PrpD